MFTLIVVLAVSMSCNAQVLRYSPLIIGSNQALAEQVISLSPTLSNKPSRVVLQNSPVLPAQRSVRQVAIPAAISVPVPAIINSPLLSGAELLRNEAPEPFSYAYTSTDEFGTTLTRQESGDANGVVSGSYGYTDAAGLTRLVQYTADASGFRAAVRTNEPGTANSNPADVVIQSTAN